MPNLITHYYFANNLKSKLSGKAQELAEQNPKAFNLGAIGPDFLFALRELGFKERLYPNTMQYIKAFEVFDLTAKCLRENPNDIQLSYMLGLMCHYVADFHMHPFVNYFVERGFSRHLPINQQPSIHSLIECAIDAHICEEKYDTPCEKFPAQITCQAPKKVRMTIGKLYEEVINGIYGYDTKAKRFSFSFALTKCFMRFSVDKHKWKQTLFNKLENWIGGKKKVTGLMRPPEGYGKIDYMNRMRVKWLKVRNLKDYSNESVDELLERAEECALRYIKNYLEYVYDNKPLSRNDFSINYEGVKVE